MSRCLFIYADGRREFHDIDPARPVWQTYDRPQIAGMSLAEAMAAPESAYAVTVRTFHRVTRFMTEDCHGPVLGGAWWTEHYGAVWGERPVRCSATWHERPEQLAPDPPDRDSQLAVPEGSA